jgi:hypothetical protein
MAKFNQGGQWTITGSEDTLLFKTGEKRHSGKGPVTEKKKVDPDSEEGKKFFSDLSKSILSGSKTNGFRQATDQELFGGLVVSEEQVQKAEQEWDNQLNGFYEEAAKPLGKQDPKDNAEWGSGKSFNDDLASEELEKRNKHIG